MEREKFIRPEGLTDEMIVRAVELIEDWEDGPDHLATPLIFKLYELLTGGT